MKQYEAPSALAVALDAADMITLSDNKTETISGDHYESAYDIWYDKLGK